MTYQVLSLKYRPQSFDELVGQTHVTQTLVNAFKRERVAQGYISPDRGEWGKHLLPVFWPRD